MAQKLDKVNKLLKFYDCTQEHHVASCIAAELVDPMIKKIPGGEIGLLCDSALGEYSISENIKTNIIELVDYIVDNFPNVSVTGTIQVIFNGNTYNFSEVETLYISDLIKSKYNAMSIYTSIEQAIAAINDTQKFKIIFIETSQILKVELTDFQPKQLYKSSSTCPLPKPIQPLSVVGGTNNYTIMIPICSTHGGGSFSCCLL